jgi:uncharacterized protein (DUF2062 family)
MRNRPILQKVARFFKYIYLKLFRINDSPQRIAVGVGLGVFFGVLPGTGPAIALGAAFLLRVNRAAALIGSVLTNTWISIPVFLVSLKAGAALTGVGYQDVNAQWHAFVKGFHFRELLDLSAYRILAPILTGYLAVSLSIGVTAYLVTLVAINTFKKK